LYPFSLLFEHFLTAFGYMIPVEIYSLMESEMMIDMIVGATLALSLLLYFVYTLVKIEEL
ncbi:hypothetical protein, partial [Sulfuricurvum sp.]|uniref:hypothetical protein n=1 Tax=Sulfuricurvum sp. TaxID=2025608 RepID=UPI003BB69198